MSDLTTLLRAQTEDEPPYAVDVDGLVSAGRRRQRRRQGAFAMAGVALVAAGAVAGPALMSRPSPDDQADVGIEPSEVVISWGPGFELKDLPRVDGPVTKENLISIIESTLGVELVEPQRVTDDRPLGNHPLDYVGNIDNGDRHGPGYLVVMLDGPGQLTVPPYTCEQLNAGGLDTDGYTGPCELRVLPSGATLVVRTGASGPYRMVQANLIRPDGSGILAESTNQAFPGFPSPGPHAGSGPDPVTRPDPPVTAERLADLVLELDSRGRG